MNDDRLYFRQLLAGRDFARDDPVARQMVNFVYLVGDRETGEAVVVDPAYGVDELVEILGADGMRLTGVLVDPLPPGPRRRSDDGLRDRGHRASSSARDDVAAKVHVQAAGGVRREAGHRLLGLRPRRCTTRATCVEVGARARSRSSTRRATRPARQCFFVDGRLVSGDTLFLDGCGRTDLPGGDPEALYESLTQKLATVPDDTVLYPGHLYSPEPSLPLGEVRGTATTCSGLAPATSG